MQKFKIEFTAFVLIYMSVITRSEVYEIFRRVNTEDGVEKWTDMFKIPPSVCRPTESSSTICAKFNARASGNGSQHCICSCSRENATFMFYKNKWTCLRNSKVRDVLGHDYSSYRFFSGENKDSSLRVLDINDSASTRALGRNCEVDQRSSHYIGCDGVDIPFSSNFFILQSRSNANNFYSLKVNSGVSNTELLRGKIIKLAITCSSFNGRESKRWILFKLVGNITCPSLESLATRTPSPGAVLPSLLSASTRPTSQEENTAPTINQTTSLVSLPITTVNISTITTSTTFTASSTVFSGQPQISVTSSSTSRSRPTVVLPQSTTRGQDTQPTSSPPRAGSEESRGNDNPMSAGFIAGIAGSATFVIILVVCLVLRRRHLRKPPRPSVISTTRKDSVITGINDSVITRGSQFNPAYEADEHNLYRSLSLEEPPIYGPHYKALQRSPAGNTQHKSGRDRDEEDAKEDHYAPLNIPEDQNIYGHTNIQEPFYNVLEEDEIIYQNYGSSLEEPVNKSEEPVYNALEESCHEKVVEPDHDESISDGARNYGNTTQRCSRGGVKGSNSDPLCKRNSFVAENPIDDGAEPVYNVLEETDDEYSKESDYADRKSDGGVIYVNTLERSRQDGAVATEDSENINEPVYSVIDDEPDTCESTDDDDFVTRDFVKNVLKELVLERKAVTSDK